MLFVDISHLAHRTRHANSTLRTSDARRSGVLHGSLRSLAYVRRTLHLSFQDFVVVWDGGRAQARMDLYPPYKQRERREPTPEELEEKNAFYSQCDALRLALRQLGVRQVQVKGCEADDLISLCIHRMRVEQEKIVSSGDRDFHQLCNLNVSIFDPRAELMSPQQVLAEHKVSSGNDILLLKALRGDPSDRITGVRGIGEVKALAALPYVAPYFLHGDTSLSNLEQAPPKVLKSVDLIFDNQEVVKRNLKLMRLPRTWDEFPHYPQEAQDSFLEQLELRPKQDDVGFTRFLRDWELVELQSMDRWA